MGTETVHGEKLDIVFEGKRCIHSRHCVLDRPGVFVPNAKGDWIHPDAAPVEAIVALAHTCPSGAISYRRHDGGAAEQAPAVNTARLRENGPIAFHAEINVNGEVSFRATLCRCGQSSNKPYCDGSHAGAGFAASGEPAAKESAPLAACGGPLKVTPLPNGPLKVDGNLEIVSGTGRTIDRQTRVFFCRCGQSQNKPFCDGSHKAAGFVG